MELVVGDVRRGVEEALAVVIIDVLPVVGDIDHRSGTIATLEDADDGVDELIRLAHGIVVGIAQDEAVGLRTRVVPLHREEGILLRIAVTVAEVTTIGMQHDEELRVLARHEALQIGDHIAIVETALLTAKLLTDGVMLVPLHSEEVHIAVVPWLIGDEGRIEARFTEGREDPLHTRQVLRRRCIGRREDDGDTLIRRIRLRQDVSKGDKPTITVERIDMWRRLTGIAVEAPAVCTRRLTEDEDVDLTLILGTLGGSLVAEVLAGAVIVQHLIELRRRQIHIMEDAHRIDLSTQMHVGEALLRPYIYR